MRSLPILALALLAFAANAWADDASPAGATAPAPAGGAATGAASATAAPAPAATATPADTNAAAAPADTKAASATQAPARSRASASSWWAGPSDLARLLPSIPKGWAAEQESVADAQAWGFGWVSEASRSYFKQFVAGGDSVQITLLDDRGTGYARDRFGEVSRLPGASASEETRRAAGGAEVVEVALPDSEASEIAVLKGHLLVRLHGSSVGLDELRRWLARMDVASLREPR